jgi:hypothetical protein
LKDLSLSVLADYSVNIIGISDSGLKSNVNVTIAEVNVNFDFNNNGQIRFNKFDLTVGSIDIELHSIIYKAAFWLFKGMILNAIKGQANTVKETLTSKINEFVTKPTLIELQFGIALNLTNTMLPELNFYPLPSLEEMEVGSNTNNLRNYYDSKALASNSTTSTLNFGVHGSIYSPFVAPKINPASKMSFQEDDKVNDLSILLSDYTINTMLFMAQQSSFLRFKMTNETAEGLPFTLDTNGLAMIIPELPGAFSKNYPVDLNLIIDPVDNSQPILKSNLLGSRVNLNATLEFLVRNQTSAIQNPFKAVSLTFELEILAQLISTKDKKLTIQIPKTEILALTSVSKIGNINTPEIQRSLDSIIFVALKSFSDKTQNIDFSPTISQYTGLATQMFDIDYEDGGVEISLNLVKP